MCISLMVLSGHVQDWECTKCPGACRAPTYLQGVNQGEQIPAECLGRNEKKAVFSFCSSLAIYNGWVTWRKELNKVSQPVPLETRWPYRPADLGSAIGLAPQSLGPLVSLKD